MIDGGLYYDYFLHQAKSHPLLLHADDRKVFALVSVEEAIGDLRSPDLPVGAFIMRLVEPFYRITRGQDNLPMQRFEGGWMIAKHYNQKANGSQDYIDAINDSEQICQDIVEKLYADSENGHPFLQYAAADSLEFTARIRPVVGDAGYGGWLFLFSISVHGTYCVPAQRTAWLDGGKTPHEL